MKIDPLTSMWLEACDMLDRSDRLRRQLFVLADSPTRYACWEPPVDVFEANSELQVVVLLPGVSRDKLAVQICDDVLMITGESPFPVPNRAKIHRLEIPYGAFEKRLHLPSPYYELKSSEYQDGFLTLHLVLAR